MNHSAVANHHAAAGRVLAPLVEIEPSLERRGLTLTASSMSQLPSIVSPFRQL